jgi:predicted DNA-binding transcriptional regulator YafY
MTVERDGDQGCVVTAGGDDPERMVLHFAMVGADFQVLEPAEVQTAACALGKRLHHAGGAP